MRERKFYYKPSQWLMICDECGKIFYSSEMQQRWDNLWVCADDFEIRHPQLDVRAIRDKMAVPVARPRSYPGDLEMLDTLEMTDGLILGYSGPTYITTPITPDDL